MDQKMNARFLKEAEDYAKHCDELGSRWHKAGLLDEKYSRSVCAVLMESMRLRNEFQTDEEYAKYVEEFKARQAAVLKCLKK